MNLQDQSFSVAKTNLAKKKRLVIKARNKLEKLQKEVDKAEEELENAESEYENAQFQVEIFKRKHNVEEIFWRFPHIGEQILEKIDNQSVANCRQVNKWWYKFVDQGKALLIRKIQRHICISTEKLRKSLNKLSLEDLTNFEDLVRMIRNVFDRIKLHNEEDCGNHVFNRLISDHGRANSEPYLLSVCDLMLDNMETKNPANELYGTALHRITPNNNLAMFKLIFEKMENKNPKDRHGSTLLHIAAENGCSRIVKFILENSDNMNITNNDGKTPLNLAEENNHKDVCKLLTSAISKQNSVSRNPPKKRKLT